MRAIHRHPVILSASLVAAFAFAALAAAPQTIKEGDWPQWRGPNRDSVSTETGLLDKWPEDGPPLLWTAKNLGAGLSSVSLQGGHIYTMGDRGEQQFVICLNAEGGDEIWSTPVGKKWVAHNDDPGPRCIPAADGDLVYALGSDGDLVCLESATGKVHWKLNFQKDFGGKRPHWGFTESPLVDGDWLVCTPGGKDAMMVALNKLTGEPVWKCAVPDFGKGGGGGAAYSSIVVSDAAGVKQYVQLIGHGLIGVAAADGKFLWGYNKIANGTANIPTPIVRGDYVFDSTGYGTGAVLLKLSKDGDVVKADEVYFLKHEDLQNHHGGMVLVGDYLYGGHGHGAGAPICLEFLTGKIKWKENHGPGSGSAAVLYADGKLYFRYQDGTMALIEATPEHYNLISRFQIPDVKSPSWPHPVIAGGKLYLREQDSLLCYRLK
jgi:outer membrane protein assembly factor BamB